MADPSLKHAASLVPVGPFAGKPAMPLTRPVIVVGSGKNARILLKSESVSTTHTLLIHTSTGWYFRDLVSRTHTILNGKSYRESALKNGDTLTIGAFVFHFVSVGHVADVVATPPAAMEVTDAEIPVPIDTKTVLIGRRVGCEVRLIEDSVSLVHAVIYEVDGVHYLRDLYSRTGTFLNGHKIHQEPLKFGDVIVIGETTIKYVPDQSATFVPFDEVADAPASQAAEPPVEAPSRPLVPELPPVVEEAVVPLVSAPIVPDPVDLADAPVVPLARRELLVDLPPVESAEIEAEVEVVSPVESIPASPTRPAVANQPLAIEPERVEPESVEPEAKPEPIAERQAEPAIDVEDEVVASVDVAEEMIAPSPAVEEPTTSDRDAEPIAEEGRVEEVIEPVFSQAAVTQVRDVVEEAAAPAAPVASSDAPLEVSDESSAAIEPAIEPVIEPIAEVADEVEVDEAESAVPLAAVSLEPVVETSPADALPVVEAQSAEPVAEAHHDDELHVDGHAQGERPLIAPQIDDLTPPGTEVPTEVSELAALQAKIHAALSDPTTLLNEPFVAPEPSAPAMSLSESARRARTIMEMLESTEEFEKEAEAESAAVAFTEPQNLDVQVPELPAIDVPEPIDVVGEDASDAVVEEMTTPAAQAVNEVESAADVDVVSDVVEVEEHEDIEATRDEAAVEFVAPESASPGLTPAEVERRVEQEIEQAADAATQIAADPPEPPHAAIELVPEDVEVAASAAAQIADTDDLVTPAAAVIESEPLPLAEPEPVADIADVTPLVEHDVVVAAEGAAEIADADALVSEPVLEPLSASVFAPTAEAIEPEPLPLATPEPAMPADVASIIERDLDVVDDAAEMVIEPVVDERLDAKLTTAASLAESLPAATIDLSVDDALVAAALAPTPIEPIEIEALSLAAGESAVVGDEDDVTAIAPAVDDVAIEPILAEAVPQASASDDAIIVSDRIVSEVAETPAAEPVASVAEAVESIVEPVAEEIAHLPAAEEPDVVVEASAFVEDAPVVEAAVESADDSVVEEEATTAKGRKPKKPRAAKGARTRKSPKIVAAENADAIAQENLAASLIQPTPIVDADVIGDSPFADTIAVQSPESPDVRVTIDESTGEPVADQMPAIEPIAEAFESAPTTLSELANAVPDDSLPVEEILVPSRVALEPGELPIEQAEEVAPIEIDQYNAGEVIATQPRTLDEIEVEAVSPMFDPDPGAIADRDALDGLDAVLADDAARAEAQDEQAVAIVEEIEAEEAPSAVELIAGPAADSVVSSLEVAEASTDDTADESRVDSQVRFVEADTDPTSVASIALDVTDTSPESDEASLVDDLSTIAPSAFAIEGASVVEPISEPTPDEAEAELLAPTHDASTDDAPADDVLQASVEVVDESTDSSAPVVLAFEATGEPVEAPESIVDEPAPLDGSTLVNAPRLAITSAFEIDAVTESDTESDAALNEAGSALDVSSEAPAADTTPHLKIASYDADAAEPPAISEADRGVLPAESVKVQGKAPTAIVNVDVPSLDELEASYQDAFADALAMAEGASFAKPAVKSPSPADAQVDVAKPTIEPASEEKPATAPVADVPKPAARPAAKWELDESLLDQVKSKPMDPLAGMMSAPAGFMSLGGIGWIGDEATDEYEAVPTKINPKAFPRGLQPLHGPLSGRRESRKRRPVAGQTSEPPTDLPAELAVGPIAETSGDAIASSEALSVESPAESSIESIIESADAIAPIDEIVDIAESIETPTPTDEAIREADEADVVGLDATPIELSDESAEPLIETAKLADEPDVTTLPTATEGAASETLPPKIARPTLPPRPVRNRPSRAAVDDSLESAASASPFAEQALPLVDAFSQAPTAGLDEMLAKLGAAEGQFKDTPPITQDRPATTERAVPSPFASQVPIQRGSANVSPGIRRVRQQMNKLPLLLLLMVGIMGITALGAWYMPIGKSLQVNVLFDNYGRQTTLEQQRIRDETIALMKSGDFLKSARRNLPDRYGEGGFFDRPDQFSSVIASARFENRDDGTGVLVLEHQSNTNQLPLDIARMNAVAAQVVTDSKPMLDHVQTLRNQAGSIEQTIARSRTQVAQLKDQRQTLQKTYESMPETSELRRVENDVNSLTTIRDDARKHLDDVESKLRRLQEHAMLFVPSSTIASEHPLAGVMLADATGALPAGAATQPARDWRSDLDRLVAERDLIKARLDQLEQAQTPEARSARDGFDKSLVAFAAEIESASKSLGDRPEVLQYVDNARRLQEQIRGTTDTLVRRQQQQLTRLAELQQQLRELTESTQQERFANDPKLKDWTDRLAIQERLLNTARADNAGADDIASLEAEIALLKNMIAGQRENLNNPQAVSVTKQLEGMVAATSREMAADRAHNDKMLSDIQDTFRRQQPAVEKLPDDQKQLAQTLSTRLAQIDLARQRYTDSLAISAGGDTLQISELRTKLAAIEPQIVEAQSNVDASELAQAAEMQRRAQAAEMLAVARDEVAAARTALDDAQTKLDARTQTLATLRERVESGRRAAERNEQIGSDLVRIEQTINNSIAQLTQVTHRLDSAVVPKPAALQGKAFVREAPGMDLRMVYGASAIGLIAVIFGFLIARESRNRLPVAKAQAAADEAIPSHARVA